MNTEMGVAIYMHLKHSPNDIDSKYIWVHGFNSLGASVFPDVPFLAFFPKAVCHKYHIRFPHYHGNHFPYF